MFNIEIVGTGYYAPKKILTNDDLAKMVDTNDAWITQMTGIKERRIASEEETSDLAVKAVENLMEQYPIDRHKIRYIIVATFSPDQFTPSVACKVQAKLGLNGCQLQAFDVNAACSGFVYSLNIASRLLEEEGDIALVIGSEVISKLVDWSDRSTCILFGDGAGAMAISKQATGAKLVHYGMSIGDEQGFLKTKNIKDENCFVEMHGNEVFKFAVSKMPEAIEKVLAKANVDRSEIDYIIPHQANIRIIAHVAKKMKMEMEQFFVNIDQFGNTSAASIPMAIAQMNEQKILKKGMKIILVGFGAGFTYGATYLEV